MGHSLRSIWLEPICSPKAVPIPIPVLVPILGQSHQDSCPHRALSGLRMLAIDWARQCLLSLLDSNGTQAGPVRLLVCTAVSLTGQQCLRPGHTLPTSSALSSPGTGTSNEVCSTPSCGPTALVPAVQVSGLCSPRRGGGTQSQVSKSILQWTLVLPAFLWRPET